MKPPIRVLGAIWLTCAATVPAAAGKFVAVRGAAKPVVAPAGLAGAAMLASPGLLSLEAPRLAPVGANLGLPVVGALATPALDAPLAEISARAAVSKSAAAAIARPSPASAPASASVHAAREMGQKRLLPLGEKARVNAADKRHPLVTAIGQIQNAAKIADQKRIKTDLGAFAGVFDGGMQREPTPVWTEDARRAIGAKTAPKRDYLKEADGLEKQALLGKLRDISGRGYRSHSYKETRTELFSNIDNFKFEGRRGVMAAYSQVFVPGNSGDGSRYRGRGDANGDGYSNKDGMNTEHLWPQSYFSSRRPMVSDVHHLMATFVRPNSERSRYPFGEVPDGEAVYKNSAGAKLGNEEFEPPDIVKGRVARGMLYFFMRYGNRNILPDRQARNFWNSRIEMFIRWHEAHPPGVFERRRNDLAEAWQGNRNPFVDDPGLVGRVGVEAFTIQTGRGRSVAGRKKKPEIQYAAVSKPEPVSRESAKSRRSSGNKGKKKRGHRKKRRKHGR